MTKVAVCGFAPNQGQYGGAQGAVSSAYHALVSYAGSSGRDLDVDVIYATGRGVAGKNWIAFDHPVKIVKTSDWLSTLSRYDFVFLTTPGPFKMKPEDPIYQGIVNLDVPFSVRLCAEMDPKIYPGLPEFLANPNCVAVTATNPHISLHYEDAYLQHLIDLRPVIELDPLVAPHHLWPNPEIVRVIDGKNSGSPMITSISRWVSWKRVYELIKIAPELKADGFTVDIFGGSNFFHECEKYRALNSGSWTEKGEYDNRRVDHILAPYGYLWGPSARWNGNAIPRFDYSMVEGCHNGCVPIVSETMCPEWFKRYAIVVPVIHHREDFHTIALEKILELHESDGRKELAFKAYAAMKARYNMHDMWNRFEDLLKVAGC